MKCSVVTTTNPDIASALEGLIQRVQDGLSGAAPDLVVTFYTSHHSGDVELIRKHILEGLQPGVLMGCPAVGVIGEDVEVEGQAGLTLWAASWPGAELTPFQIGVDGGDSEKPFLEGWPEPSTPPSGVLVLVDPYTTPADELLVEFSRRYPGCPLAGGMASGSPGPGAAQLMTKDGILDEGAIGVAIGGDVVMETVVSQGCRPVGHHFVVTQADKNLIVALGGKPALVQLQHVLEEVDEADRDLMHKALHVGRVVDERKSEFETGDFLVRNLLGIDQKRKAIAISDYIRRGTTIQFMVRDAAAATEEMTTLFAREQDKAQPVGALLFSCNGRGSRFFGQPNHDIAGVHAGVGDVPTAGFFAAGEIGPVGGQPFLHGYTASVALFRERDPS